MSALLVSYWSGWSVDEAVVVRLYRITPDWSV
jgi:hypothetical protein